jgi:hypothetical protein
MRELACSPRCQLPAKRAGKQAGDRVEFIVWLQYQCYSQNIQKTELNSTFILKNAEKNL